MKYIITILFILVFNFSCCSQKDTIKYDTLTILSYQTTIELINYMQMQASGKVDVKDEVWAQLIKELSTSIQLVPKQVPNKEQPKK